MQILVSSRSSVTSSLHALRARICLLAERCGASVVENAIYPGWNPNPDSALTRQVMDIYASTFDLQPHLTAVHAGLEVRSIVTDNVRQPWKGVVHSLLVLRYASVARRWIGQCRAQSSSVRACSVAY